MNLIMSKILDFESNWTKLLRLCLKISVILKVKIDLKSDKIKFNPDIKAPLVFVDEAAHMNTL